MKNDELQEGIHMGKSHGNRAAQRFRRKHNNAGTPIQKEPYLMIDGNWTKRPSGYCLVHHGFLTNNMALRHRCVKKNCPHYRTFEQQRQWYEERKKCKCEQKGH